MVKLRWERQMWLDTVYTSISLFFIAIIADIILNYYHHGEIFIGFGGVTFAIILGAGLLTFTYALSRDAWHSIKTRIFMQIPNALSIIHKALTDADIPFTVMRTDHGRKSFLENRWEEVIELDYGGLRLHLQSVRGRTELFLGPVKRENEREVAKVKGLIGSGFGEA